VTSMEAEHAPPPPKAATNSMASTLRGLSISSWLEPIGHAVLTSADGLALNAYHAGSHGKPPVLLINPIGVSVLLLAPLMRHLAQDYFVLSWETRGLPSLNPDREEISTRIDDHLDDACRILDHYGVGAVDLVSYCSGTSIALSLLGAGRIKVSKAVFISPSVLIEEKLPMTNHQRTVVPIWADVAKKGRAYCTIMSNLMAPKRPHDGNVQAELDYVNRLPFVDGSSTYQYARLLASVNQTRYSDLFDKLSIPVLLLHATDDDLIHVELSRYMHRRICNSKLHLVENGGHYAICKNEAMHAAISGYLARRQPLEG
jgi:3-oxoadipate enol-lactonase